MPLSHAILGFLDYRPMIGYDLKNTLINPSRISGLPPKAISTMRWKTWKMMVLSSRG